MIMCKVPPPNIMMMMCGVPPTNFMMVVWSTSPKHNDGSVEYLPLSFGDMYVSVICLWNNLKMKT